MPNQYKVIALNEKYDGPKEVLGQCSKDFDCGNNTDFPTLCVNSRCLNEGRPRITLTWVGDDDLDLRVTTPFSTNVNYIDDFDPESQGSFDTGFTQTTNGSHVESIFFPYSGRAPGGIYTIEVISFQQRGEAADLWTLEVFDRGLATPVLTERDTGGRVGPEAVIYFRSDRRSNGTSICSTENPNVECCEDNQCIAAESREDGVRRCENRQCISIGSPSFTLSSYGSKFLNLLNICVEMALSLIIS